MKTFDWSPGIGDPTIVGWFTVLLYLVATISCWRVTRWLGETGCVDREDQTWRGLTVLLLALGINKQLDLQTAFTEAGRVLAFAQGWYEQRQIVQVCFIAFVAALALTAMIVLIHRTRHTAPATRLAMIGAIMLLSFVVIRAASFHHFDRFIGSRFFGLKWNWILEIDGIALVLFASLRRHPEALGLALKDGVRKIAALR